MPPVDTSPQLGESVSMGLTSSCIRGALAVLVVSTSACSGNDPSSADGDGPPEAPADVCALLTLDDAQMLLPSAMAGEQQRPVDYPDTWIRTCDYRGSAATYVELQVIGALSPAGTNAIDIQARGHGDGPRTSVSGLGDTATFYSSMGGLSVGLVARRGNTLVDLGVNLAEQPPTEAALDPFVRRVFDRL